MQLPDTIHLRRAQLHAEAALPLDDLSAAERDRLDSFGSTKRQRSFALGRSVLRRLLSERLGVEPEAVPLVVAEDGALELDGLFLSLAHTEAHGTTEAVAVVAEEPVGVDLEALRPVRADLTERLLSDADRGIVTAFPPEEAALRVWVIKEAVLKAMRTGFRCSPRALCLEATETSSAIVRGPGGRVWAVHHVREADTLTAVALLRRGSR